MPPGFPATPCDPGNPKNLPNPWFLYYPGDPQGTFYDRVAGLCYYANIFGEGSNVPDDAQAITISGTYTDCHSCRGGARINLCANQDTTNAPALWCSAADIPSSLRCWRDRGFCWWIDSTAGIEDIPAGAIVVTPPPTQYPGCTQCVLGVLAVLCPGQKNASKATMVWVPLDWAGTSVSIQNIFGFCYSVRPSDTPVPKPAKAIVAVAVNDFASCVDCLCGIRIPPQGAQAQLCGFQDSSNAEDIWVPADAVGDSEILFQEADADGNLTCYFLPADAPIGDIPSGAKVIRPVSVFQNCWDCFTNLPAPEPGEPGGPGGPPGKGSGPGSPPGGGGGNPPVNPPGWPPPLSCTIPPEYQTGATGVDLNLHCDPAGNGICGAINPGDNTLFFSNDGFGDFFEPDSWVTGGEGASLFFVAASGGKPCKMRIEFSNISGSGDNRAYEKPGSADPMGTYFPVADNAADCTGDPDHLPDASVTVN
jgi:hypothetical protein